MVRPPLTGRARTPKWNPFSMCGGRVPPMDPRSGSPNVRTVVFPLVVVVLFTEQREECGHLDLDHRPRVPLGSTRCLMQRVFLCSFTDVRKPHPKGHGSFERRKTERTVGWTIEKE
jgi:hypothetical protein